MEETHSRPYFCLSLTQVFAVQYTLLGIISCFISWENAVLVLGISFLEELVLMVVLFDIHSIIIKQCSFFLAK